VLEAFGRTGLEIIGHVPDDGAVADAEVHEQSLLKVAGDSPALAAIDQVLGTILERRNV
jgi:hypothetical protein